MLENCRWFLYASRFYGCHPHTIDDERSRVPANFRLPLLAYSLIMCGLYCVVGYYAKSFRDYCNTDTVTVDCVLQQGNRYNRCFYMILTPLLSCLRYAEFERAVAVARKFDDLMRHHNSRCNDNKRMNCCMQWLIILTILVAWIVISILIMFAVPHMILYLLALQIITRITFSMEIAKFYFLYDALYRRFRRLNGLCRKLTGMDVGIDTGISMIHINRLTISNLQQLYSCLIDATNHLNSYYSLQLFCWIACMLLDIISYIFGVLRKRDNVLLTCVQCIMLLIFSFQVITISRICHLTCGQANALAGTMFLAKTPALKHTEFSIEAIELGVRLRIFPLRVRVCGLFNLDNSLAFSVFGIILMYVVLTSSIH
ncbi:uncharacterized protein [Polyergus mexicanus]|uniref:uncharacterized protein isoform X1 n=1 Tax=Polyergus mexicanus TaxID=615972 RepID=UPI0038B6ACAB